MKICDLPISFFNDDGQVQILLAAVGIKVPRVFSLLSGYIQKIINDLDLDSSSWLPESLGLKGTVKFSLSTCESPDALPFLLGLGDEQLPHNDFHVIVGAALAESQDDLVNFSKNFVQTVNSLSPRSVPCLYVFSTASFE